ncbi:MAG TPA: class I SAM-dependent methyltransferase [Gemmatimonadales bacterium]|nr:class I SAM-dependent methyltransferase [Gemmatimonadales bacterium]
MTWASAHDAGPAPEGLTIAAPVILNLRAAEWDQRLGGKIDTETSDPATLDVLSMLVRHLEATVIVEAGTYRGWGSFTMAETLKAYGVDGHIWTADPIDYEIHEVLEGMGLADYVTYTHGTFEEMLPTVPGEIDLAYIDASDKGEQNLRLRYLSLVLPRMRAGGLVVIDDCAKGWEGAPFVQQLASVYLPLHRGLAILQKRV